MLIVYESKQNTQSYLIHSFIGLVWANALIWGMRDRYCAVLVPCAMLRSSAMVQRYDLCFYANTDRISSSMRRGRKLAASSRHQVVLAAASFLPVAALQMST